jgi:hypothetical protein
MNKRFFYKVNTNQDGSGRASICRDPINVLQTTIWSHTVTARDINAGKPGILEVCLAAYNELRISNKT